MQAAEHSEHPADLLVRLEQLNDVGVPLSRQTDISRLLGKTLSEGLRILAKIKEDGNIDPDLFDVFMWQRVYLDCASKWMDPEQIDAIDTSKISGYVDPPAR